jgi:hypothetical protein
VTSSDGRESAFGVGDVLLAAARPPEDGEAAAAPEPSASGEASTKKIEVKRFGER